MCGRGVVAGTKGVRDMFRVKGGLVSETKVDYHHQKKNFTYFHYFITLSPPFDHYRDNKAGPGGGVLPYMGYIGTCRGIGYGF